MESVPLDFASLAELAGRIGYTPRRELHCHPSVSRLLMLTLPEADPEFPFTGSIGALAGIPVTEKPDFEPGAWEIREDGEVTASGRVDVPPWIAAPVRLDVTFPPVADRLRLRAWLPLAPPAPFMLSGIC